MCPVLSDERIEELAETIEDAHPGLDSEECWQIAKYLTLPTGWVEIVVAEQVEAARAGDQREIAVLRQESDAEAMHKDDNCPVCEHLQLAELVKELDAARAAERALVDRVEVAYALLTADEQSAKANRYDTPAHHARWNAAAKVLAAVRSPERCIGCQRELVLAETDGSRERWVHPADECGRMIEQQRIEGGLIDVELLHAPRPIHPLTEAGTLDESVVLHTYCDECTPDATVSMIEDAEWNEDWPIVEHPCRTVTFLRRALAARPDTAEGETPDA